MNLHFDPTVKLGDIVTVISFIGFGIAAFYKIKNQLDIHSLRLTNMEATMLTNAETLKLVVAQEIKIRHMEEDLRDLKQSM